MAETLLGRPDAALRPLLIVSCSRSVKGQERWFAQSEFLKSMAHNIKFIFSAQGRRIELALALLIAFGLVILTTACSEEKSTSLQVAVYTSVDQNYAEPIFKAFQEKTGITVKAVYDVEAAKTEIPSLFDAGITSIAIDASHLPDDLNLLANLELNPYVPGWSGLETEVGEIKGKEGLSTVEEAGFLIQGLNAHSIFPNWIALNNGTTHGIEQSDKGIQVELTTSIHDALEKYQVSGAQHGTSGNSSDRLRDIAAKTRTTKANVATALQMISWGLEVNDYGNAQLDTNGNFIKVKDEGVTEDMWQQMVSHAESQGLKGGNYKKLNLPFENKLLGQSSEVRTRMVKRVEAFVYNMLVNVFNAEDTAQLAIDDILETGSHDPGPKTERIEDPAEWTPELIKQKAAEIDSDKGPEGDFDD
jgi:fructose/tagatose bisphosphate aldolase